MGYTYDMTTSHQDGKSQNCLFLTHTLAGVINLFVTTFLVAHIYSFNGDTYSYLFNVGIYNLFMYAGLLVFYGILSKFVDKTNRVVFYRAGIIVKALLVILVVFFGQKLAKLLILAGVLNGTAEAFYYSSYNVIKQEMVSRKTMNGFVANTHIYGKIVEVVCPVLLGFFIDATTYSIAAIVVLVVCFIQVGVSFGIKAKRPDGSHFSIKEYIQRLRELPAIKKKVKFIYIISALYGSVTLTTNIINVCIMLEYGESFSLGILTSVFALCSILVLIFFKRFSKPGKRKWLFIFASLLPILSVLVFVIKITPITIVILNGAIALTSVIYKYLVDIYRNGILKEAGLYDEIAEHHTIVEIAINISRVACFGILMLVALLKSMLAFKIFAVVGISTTSIIFLILYLYEKVIAKEKCIKEGNQ